MTLDIQKFKNSNFFRKNAQSYNAAEKKIYFHNQNLLILDATSINLDKLNNYKCYNQNTVSIRAGLFANLRYSDLDHSWQNEIINQWKEVTKITNNINLDYIISTLVITLPSTTVDPHKHFDLTKQTITFRFIYDCEIAENVSPSVYILEEQKKLSLEDYDTAKSFFSIRDNKIHGAKINKLTFFWLFDYPDYVDIDNVDFGEFKYCEFY